MSELIKALEMHQQGALELIKIAAAASEQIEAEELLYLQEERGIREMRTHLDNLEMGVTAQVAGAKDETTGKPVFTNDALRKSEVAERLSNLAIYRESWAKHFQSENDQKMRRLRIEKLSRDYSVCRLAYEGLTIGRRER